MFIRLQKGIYKLIITALVLFIIDKIFASTSIALGLCVIVSLFIFYKPNRVTRPGSAPVSGVITRVEHKHGSDTLEIDIATIPLLHSMTMRFTGKTTAFNVDDDEIHTEYVNGITIVHKPIFGTCLDISKIGMDMQTDCKSYGFMIFGGTTRIKIPRWSTNQQLISIAEHQHVIDGETPLLITPLLITPSLIDPVITNDIIE